MIIETEVFYCLCATDSDINYELITSSYYDKTTRTTNLKKIGDLINETLAYCKKCKQDLYSPYYSHWTRKTEFPDFSGYDRKTHRISLNREVHFDFYDNTKERYIDIKDHVSGEPFNFIFSTSNEVITLDNINRILKTVSWFEKVFVKEQPQKKPNNGVSKDPLEPRNPGPNWISVKDSGIQNDTPLYVAKYCQKYAYVVPLTDKDIVVGPDLKQIYPVVPKQTGHIPLQILKMFAQRTEPIEAANLSIKNR